MLGRVGLGTTLWTDAQAPLVWQCGNQKDVEVTRMGWYLMSVTGAKVCLFGTCWMQSGRQFICYSETNDPHQSYPHVMSDLALTSPPLCFCPHCHASLGAMKSYSGTLRAGAFAGFEGFCVQPHPLRSLFPSCSWGLAISVWWGQSCSSISHTAHCLTLARNSTHSLRISY